MKKTRLIAALLAALLIAAGGKGYKMVKFEQKSKTGNVVISGEYPQVEGDPKRLAGINQKLKSFVVSRDPNKFEKEDAEFYAGNHYTEEVNTEVTLLDNQYISLEVYRLGMLQQAAHPSNEFAGLTLSLASGKEMTLKDFLKPGTEQKLYEKIKARSYKVEPELQLDDHKTWDFVLIPGGVRFINLVEGHAVAAYTVELTWKDLAELRK